MLKRSIKKYLLVHLLLGLALVTGLAVIGNLALEHRNFENKMDFELEITAHTMASLLQDNLTSDELNEAQNRLETMPGAIRATRTATGIEQKNLNLFIQSQQFQIWDSNNRLILHSYAAPTFPLVDTNIGFNQARQEGVSWRTYTLYLPQEGYRIVIMQRQDFRVDIEKQITEDSIAILIIASPFFGLLIWFIVGQSLRSLNRLVDSIKRRKTQNLSALSTRDIPEEVIPMIDELNRLLHELDEALAREKRFSANAAHELRTPLAALLAQAQVALHASNLEEAKGALEKVIAGADRSAHVVDQLLTLSRVAPHAKHNAHCALDLRLLCQNIVAELLHQADHKNITLALECIDMPHNIQGDEGMLMILLRNLLDNAIRYSPKGSEVKIILTEERSKIWLHIIDAGPGLSAEHKKRVFERFFRVLGTKETGSGLGLAIVKQIALLHNAHIELNQPQNTQGLQVSLSFKKTSKK